MSFHVGQMVVCVNDSRSYVGSAPPEVERGRVYTIRQIGLVHPGDGVRRPCVRLVEVKNGRMDSPLFASRFRPVRETSIEIFQQLLVNPPKEVVS